MQRIFKVYPEGLSIFFITRFSIPRGRTGRQLPRCSRTECILKRIHKKYQMRYSDLCEYKTKAMCDQAKWDAVQWKWSLLYLVWSDRAIYCILFGLPAQFIVSCSVCPRSLVYLVRSAPAVYCILFGLPPQFSVSCSVCPRSLLYLVRSAPAV